MSARLARRASIALGAIIVAALAGPAAAKYPESTETLVIPFAAGGSTDVVGRIVAERMSAELGRKVVVQNVSGPGGSLGAVQVAGAEADGYTIPIGTVATHALYPLILTQKPYDPVADFAPVSLLVVVPNVLAVNPALGVTTVQGLIDLAKIDPAALAYASSDNDTPLHLSGELFRSMAGWRSSMCPPRGPARR